MSTEAAKKALAEFKDGVEVLMQYTLLSFK
jgi:hypothetical protein